MGKRRKPAFLSLARLISYCDTMVIHDKFTASNYAKGPVATALNYATGPVATALNYAKGPVAASLNYE